MLIVNQDRDKAIEYSGELAVLPVVHNGRCWGANLIMGVTLLGTFDTQDEGLEEVDEIQSYQGDVYYVSGYSAEMEDLCYEMDN